jgi:DNA polymerase-3 subunit delta'
MSANVELTLPEPSWTAAERARLRQAFEAQHLPHALLIHEAPGAGGEWLALWAASLVLCRNHAAAPCGTCVACRRVALSAELALTSHAGGYKVGIISPADALNRFAANALLKTLEEPPARTLLVLVATQPSRLPPTILSRCQRLRVRAPTRAEARAWLSAVRGEHPWDAALDTLGEAPLLAVRADPEEVAAVGAEAQRTLEALAAGSADPSATAERWARAELALRLQCFENWLTERIRRDARAGAFMTEMRAGPYLSEATPVLNIRELFRLVDEVRELRATLDVPLNRGVALEVLFRRLAP